MKLKEIIIGVVAVALVVIVAVGATLAYLTATDEETNVMTVGDIELEILEFERVSTDKSGVDAQLQAFTNSTKKLIPSIVPAEFDYTKKEATVNWDKDKDGKEIKTGYTSNIWDPTKIISAEDKMVFVKNTGKYADAYVRIYFAFEAGQYASFEQFQNKIRLNINETDWDWKWDQKLAEVKGMKCFVACATYKTAIAPGELTNISLSQIALDVNATNADSASFGDKYDVLLVAQGIQSEEMGTPEAALNNGFGTDVPFAGFRYVDFTILKTALHYLDANTNGTTFKGTWDHPNTLLNTVTFGLFEDYYEKVLGHEGVATTNASGDGEFEGYTYYVPNGDKYDLYVLTDSGVIYMPKECNVLFAYMQSLTKVSTDNMDVSRVTTMSSMFRGCSTLEELDVSDWDVSKVTNMSSMFQDCQTVTALDVSGWKTAGVKNISSMFSGCSNLASIDVSDWTVDNVTEMNAIFKYCPKLASPMNLSGWKVGKVTSMMLMFEGCTSLTELNVSGWDVSNAKSLRGIFKNCNLLTELEVAGWPVSEKNTSLLDTFFGCSNLKQLDLSSWNVSGVTDMTRTFAGCSSLSSLNVSTWDVGAVTTMADMFSGCSSLASLNVSNWNVNKVTSMTSLFNNCSSLTSLDISKWNVGNVTAMNNMFLYCKKLTELDLSEWNTSEVKHARNMFRGCSELVTIYVGDGWEMSQIPEENVGLASGEKSSALMFLECPKLVGGAGTKFNASNPTDKTYAHIDGEDGKPGYLTQGPAPANP